MIMWHNYFGDELYDIIPLRCFDKNYLCMFGLTEEVASKSFV